MNPGRSFLLLAGIALLGAITDAATQEQPRPLLNAPQVEGREGGPVPSQRVIPQTADAEQPVSAGNALWALPLEQLSITRERPLFSPSRRPPPPPPTYVAPVAVPQPLKPPEPQRPAVSLIGTVTGTNIDVAVILETKTQNVVRLRVGEDHQGWVLRRVKAREVTMVKDLEQILMIEAPARAQRLHWAARSVPPPVPNYLAGVATGAAVSRAEGD